MVTAQVQVARIGRDREGLFGDTKEGKIHAACPVSLNLRALTRRRGGPYATGKLLARKLIDVDDLHDLAIVVAQCLRLGRRDDAEFESLLDLSWEVERGDELHLDPGDAQLFLGGLGRGAQPERALKRAERIARARLVIDS